MKRRRSRSPRGEEHHHRDQRPKVKLPFGSQHLHKRDFESYRALFVEYLDLQKQLDVDELDEHEVKGRWKSFLNKWNGGELAEGWYDAKTKKRADNRALEVTQTQPYQRPARSSQSSKRQSTELSDEDEDGYGPTLAGADRTRIVGPAVPSRQDLQHRQELAEDDRSARIADLRYEHKQDRQTQKERLEELVPRAEPGSRERQLEKKRDAAMSNRAFAEAKETGTDEIGDGDLMGDDVENYKAKMRAMEKQKNEREIKKEEVLRARAAEREDKTKEHRRKEAKTMDMLRAIAQQRFGGGD